MNRIDRSNIIHHNLNFMNYVFYEWFVRYNPLYFVSAACFVIGVFLVSQGMHNINFIDGQIILTAVIESYEILLLTGSFILFRMVSQARPAVILAIMNIFFLVDQSTIYAFLFMNILYRILVHPQKTNNDQRVGRMCYLMRSSCFSMT